jgi:hypothetical protein
MTDYINSYAARKQYYFEFYSVVSGQTVRFPALLTQLDDQFSSNWNSQNVFGRQDPVITFQNTQRTINVAFTVPSDSSEQAENNLIKLNQLIKYLYPAFQKKETANSISAAPLFRIKFANLIYDSSAANSGGGAQESGLVCGIQNFKHQFSFDGSSGWVDKVGSAVPSMFSVSFSAVILHTHDLGKIEGENYPNQANTQFPYRVNLDLDARVDAILEEADSQPTIEELANEARASRPNTTSITDGGGNE